MLFISDISSLQTNLPPLTSVARIDHLTGAQCNAYLTGYGVENIPPGVAGVRNHCWLVKVAIGCRVLR